MSRVSRVSITGAFGPVDMMRGREIPAGTYFTGDLNDYGQGLYLRTFFGFVKLTPGNGGVSGEHTWSDPGNVEVRNYQPVDVEIALTPCN